MEVFEDYNSVYITIPDKKTPIVVFFGPPYSGRTVALFRMTRFLESRNCLVNPISSFRPQCDRHYIRMCSEFKNMVYSNYAPPGNSMLDFMLVSVHNPVRQTICQILEVPGEHCFNPYDTSNKLTFPTYFNTIISCPNKKIWVFFLEQGWGDNQAVRDLYAQRICCMQELISPNDKVVFLFNKVDRQRQREQYDRKGKPRKNLFFKQIKHEYPDIFTRYKNNRLKELIYGEYDIKTVCFSSGIFSKSFDGREVWCPSNDLYCLQLWNTIQKSIK